MEAPCAAASALVVEQGCPASLGDAPDLAARLLERDGFDLSEIRDASQRLEDAVLDERRHALGPGLREHLGHAALGLDEALDLVGDDEKLVNARATSVAGTVARRAAFAPVQREAVVVLVADRGELLLAIRVRQLLVLRALGMVGLLAPVADPLDESLRE